MPSEKLLAISFQWIMATSMERVGIHEPTKDMGGAWH
jgi:hypothetical protein